MIHKNNNIIIIIVIVLTGRGKCRDLFKNCCRDIEVSMAENFDTDYLETDVQMRIVGGIQTQIKNYPFVAQLEVNKIGRKDPSFCGGSIISTNHILTAGHCITEDFERIVLPSSIKVRLGTENLGEGGEVFIVIEIHRHPNFERRVVLGDITTPAVYDIAILKLETGITFSKTKQPVDLANESYSELIPLMVKNKKHCTVLGWGKINPGDGNKRDNPRSKKIKEGTVHLMTWKKCRESLPFLRIKAELCASSAEGTSPCNGDSGGPLICGEEQIQFGLVSHGVGDGCGIPNSPYSYSRLDTAHDFISKIITL